MKKLIIYLPLFFAVISLSVCFNGYLEECNNDMDCKGNLFCYPDQRDPNPPYIKKCLCYYGKIHTNGWCYLMNYTDCISTAHCQDRDLNRQCNDKRCVCRPGTEFNSTTKICEQNGRPKKGRFSKCETDDDCFESLTCHHQKCLCKTGYVWVSSQCMLMNETNAYCQNDTDCQDQDSYRICNKTTSRCLCKTGLWPNNEKICAKRKSHNEPCPSSNDGECKDTLVCREVNSRYTCQCPNNKTWSKDQAKCLPKKQQGHGHCMTNQECQKLDQHRVCNASQQCACRPGYYEDNHKTCRQQVELGELCQKPKQCAAYNSTCFKGHSGNGLCVCQPTHRRSGENCLQRQCLNHSECQSSLFDEDPNLVCLDKKCSCRKGYSFDLVDGRCIHKRINN